MHYLNRLLAIKETNLFYFLILSLLLSLFADIKIDLFENIIVKIVITFIAFIALIIHCYLNFNLKDKNFGEGLSKLFYWFIISVLLESLAECWSESSFGSVLDALSFMAFIYSTVLFFKVPWYEFEGRKKEDKKRTDEGERDQTYTTD
jgi:hypothetical protein